MKNFGDGYQPKYPTKSSEFPYDFKKIGILIFEMVSNFSKKNLKILKIIKDTKKFSFPYGTGEALASSP